MSLAIVRSRGLVGIQAPPVAVEVHLAQGLPAFHIVGLPDAQLRESRERVRAALLQSGFDFPQRRITVNLAPADLPKGSGRFDLPIAIGILAAQAGWPSTRLDAIELMGELSLTGELKPIHGALILALAARRDGAGRTLVLPEASARHALPAEHPRLLAAGSLAAVWAHLLGTAALHAPVLAAGPASDAPEPGRPWAALAETGPAASQALPDLQEVRGQAGARRALELAAAGGHTLLFVGPPGTGKSMLARRLPGILPPLSDDQATEVAALHALALPGWHAGLWGQRPFRAPHHSASGVALIGGGIPPRPGEVSLAHGGVLFLDELAEFDRKAIEMLREPLETRRVNLSRAARAAEFPAAFQLIAAMNPCPCGWLGHASARCRCTPEEVRRYRQRLSGPVLDRIDLTVPMEPVDAATLTRMTPAESSALVRQRVLAARERAMRRQGCANADLPDGALALYCELSAPARQMLELTVSSLHLSARAVPRLLRVARTCADLAPDTPDNAPLTPAPLAEAIRWRVPMAGTVAGPSPFATDPNPVSSRLPPQEPAWP
jgi:magnesium chelatase family protein